MEREGSGITSSRNEMEKEGKKGRGQLREIEDRE